MSPRLLAVVLLASVSATGPAAAQTPTPGAIEFRYSLKGSGLLARLPDAPQIFPTPEIAATSWRLRLEPVFRLPRDTSFELAVEQRVGVFNGDIAGIGWSVLPAEEATLLRVRQLDWVVATSRHAEWRAEIDRAALRVHLPRTDVTAGRQAIGWGRGVVFSAVDLFAPFGPLEIDREWRRGVDAVRAEVRLAERLSIEAVGAFGADLNRSLFGGRVRGYTGRLDAELLAGAIGGHAFGGISMSAPVRGTEVHGEFALFDTAGGPIAAALAGTSYRVPLGNGLLVFAEYRYQGDARIPAPHAIAVLGSYEYGPTLSASAHYLQSVVDGSGVFIPSATVTCNDRLSVLFTGYVPHGAAPAGPTVRSAFGATPLGALVQVRLYR